MAVHAFHVQSITWGRARITLYGETRELEPAPETVPPTYMVAWHETFAPAEARLPARSVREDANFAFVLFAPTLFLGELGSGGALLFVVATFAAALVRRRQLGELLRRRWYVVLVPAWALLSTLWSTAPLETVKHSCEFAITVLAALLLAAPRNPRALLHGLFWAFVLYTAVSVAVGNTVPVGENGAQAFSGLTESKNEEANIAACGLIASVFVALDASRRRRVLLCAIAIAAGVLQLLVCFAALSAGALAGLTVAFGAFLVVVALRRVGRFPRGAVLALCGAVALALAVLAETSAHVPLEWAARELGKDPTLTGRTYLWYRASELTAPDPLLGLGFGAFWQQGNLDAEGLWRYAGITGRAGFNFHNTLYDALVSLGAIGVALLCFAFAAGTANLAAGYARRPALVPGFWLCMAAYTFVRMPTECVGLTEFYFSTVLLYAMLAWSRPPVRRLTPARRPALLAYACRIGRRVQSAPAAGV
ncbi:MAG TPA: O-antigen ligase family protein [Rhizomicrobium sp.]